MPPAAVLAKKCRLVSFPVCSHPSLRLAAQQDAQAGRAEQRAFKERGDAQQNPWPVAHHRGAPLSSTLDPMGVPGAAGILFKATAGANGVTT